MSLVRCSKIRLTTSLHLAPCRDEFHGPWSDAAINQVKNWNKVAKSRDAWKKLLEKARAHPGCRVIEEEENRSLRPSGRVVAYRASKPQVKVGLALGPEKPDPCPGRHLAGI
ncbi:hypothetical protein TNCV_1085351 [Trichonephila clavipes]|nr:hypothetical protein TNCV_1085351 [Trichonephila clavipes]